MAARALMCSFGAETGHVNSMAAQTKSDLPKKYLVMGKSPMGLEMTSTEIVAGKS